MSEDFSYTRFLMTEEIGGASDWDDLFKEPTSEPRMDAEQGPSLTSLSEIVLVDTPDASQTSPGHPTLAPALDDLADTTTEPSLSLPLSCPRDGCPKVFEFEHYLRRHIKTVHDKRSLFLCHFRRCPRGIPGRGFPRKDKLVDHLKSRKHELSHEDAIFEASLHNASGVSERLNDLLYDGQDGRARRARYLNELLIRDPERWGKECRWSSTYVEHLHSLEGQAATSFFQHLDELATEHSQLWAVQMQKFPNYPEHLRKSDEGPAATAFFQCLDKMATESPYDWLLNIEGFPNYLERLRALRDGPAATAFFQCLDHMAVKYPYFWARKIGIFPNYLEHLRALRDGPVADAFFQCLDKMVPIPPWDWAKVKDQFPDYQQHLLKKGVAATTEQSDRST